MRHVGYGGVCHSCNSPIAYDGEMIVIEIENTEEYWRVVPIDCFYCPHCNEPVIVMKIYKSLDVTAELSRV